MSKKTESYGDRNFKLDLWVEERHRDYFATRFRCRKVLFSRKSPFQQVDIIETESHGRMLLNDGIVMISEADEFIYHEMIAHVPLCVHPDPKTVLIIGGGDGGTAREVLRHKSVETCYVVEIDSVVVEACKKYFPKTANSFQDPKVILKIEDGIRFVKESSQKFDVILVDSTDPIGPAKPLFNEEFYKNTFPLLTDKGLLVVQAESPFWEMDTQEFILKSLKSIFPVTGLYHYNNTVYPAGFWSFALASKKLHPVKDFQSQKASQIFGLSYYNTAIHKAAFAQPEFVKRKLNQWMDS